MYNYIFYIVYIYTLKAYLFKKLESVATEFEHVTNITL